jgi:hypothetical protein
MNEEPVDDEIAGGPHSEEARGRGDESPDVGDVGDKNPMGLGNRPDDQVGQGTEPSQEDGSQQDTQNPETEEDTASGGPAD